MNTPAQPPLLERYPTMGKVADAFLLGVGFTLGAVVILLLLKLIGVPVPF